MISFILQQNRINMKRIINLFLLLATIITLTNCDNADEYGATNTYAKDEIDTTSEVVSYENLLKNESAIFCSWDRSPNGISTRASSTDFTVYGYTTKSTTGNKKVSIGKQIATAFGVTNGIYIVETITAKYEISIDGLKDKKVYFASVDSPNCGLYPDFTNDELDERGYSVSQKGNKITMATKIIHLVSDLNGRNYNKWFPCKLDELEWNYNIYSVN